MGVFCQIFVNKPRRRYHEAGKPVTGIVKYTVDEPDRYKDIIISLIGKGKCEWQERRNKKTCRYYGRELYTEQHLSIHRKETDGDFILPDGTFERPFQFFLPPNIPSSFKNSTCVITYKLILKFKKPGFFSIDKKFEIEIDVIGKVLPTMPEGVTVTELDKTLFKPFKKKKHNIKLQTEIPNTIFRPGENVQLNYKVVNDSEVIIPSIKAELTCKRTYRADCGRTKKISKTIANCMIETPSVPDNAIVNLISGMEIPGYLYTIQNSRIMWNEYKIKVTLRLPMPYINAIMKIPIVIGEKSGDTDVEYFVVETEYLEEEPPSYFEVMNESKEKDDD